MQQEPSFWT